MTWSKSSWGHFMWRYGYITYRSKQRYVLTFDKIFRDIAVRPPANTHDKHARNDKCRKATLLRMYVPTDD